MGKKIVIGKFGKVFGVHGWLKIHSLAEPKEKILEFSPWLIEKNSQWQEIVIEAHKIQHQNIIVKLKNLDDLETAKLYTNLNIFIDRSLLPKLSPNEYYWEDLIGLKVINQENQELGIVDHLFNNGANDVIVIKGAKEYLIPYIKNIILNVDLKNKNIKVNWDEYF